MSWRPKKSWPRSTTNWQVWHRKKGCRGVGNPKGGRVVSSVAFTTVSSCICTYSFGYFFSPILKHGPNLISRKLLNVGGLAMLVSESRGWVPVQNKASTVGSWVSSGCLDMLNRCCLINKMSTCFPIIIPSESTTMRHTSSPIVMIYQIRYTVYTDLEWIINFIAPFCPRLCWRQSLQDTLSFGGDNHGRQQWFPAKIVLTHLTPIM